MLEKSTWSFSRAKNDPLRASTPEASTTQSSPPSSDATRYRRYFWLVPPLRV